jgi:hypothetical protein
VCTCAHNILKLTTFIVPYILGLNTTTRTILVVVQVEKTTQAVIYQSLCLRFCFISEDFDDEMKSDFLLSNLAHQKLPPGRCKLKKSED